jgi:hypothetical protein
MAYLRSQDKKGPRSPSPPPRPDRGQIKKSSPIRRRSKSLPKKTHSSPSSADEPTSFGAYIPPALRGCTKSSQKKTLCDPDSAEEPASSCPYRLPARRQLFTPPRGSEPSNTRDRPFVNPWAGGDPRSATSPLSSIPQLPASQDPTHWKVYKKNELCIGRIVFANVIAEFVEYRRKPLPGAPPLDITSFMGRGQPKVVRKCRPLIIVGQKEDHYICLPLYTYGGQGIEHKKNPQDYCLVQDAALDRQVSPWSPHPSLMANFHSDSNGEPLLNITDKSYIKLTEPVCKQYESRVLLLGELERQSLTKLLPLYARACFPKEASKLLAGDVDEGSSKKRRGRSKSDRYGSLDMDEQC